MLAVRSDERSAAALGIGVRSVKTYAFMLGGAVAGLAGVYLTFQFPTTDFTQYDTVSSVTLVQFAVLGGLGWVGASVAGGIGTTGALLPYLVIAASGDASSINTWFALVAGFVLPFVLRQSPDGIASVIAVGFNRPESEQERQRLHIARPVWRLAGMLEVLTAGCFILAAVVRTLGLIGAASGVVVTSALLIREMGNRRSRGAAGPWRRQPLVAVSVIAACIVMGVLAKWGGWLPVFLVGQVLSAIMARRGTARLSRRFMDRLRFPRERELEHDPAPVPRREPLSLEVRGLSVRFGGVVALEGFDLVVRPGEIVGLIGPNGAGKTTALDAITGFTRPSAGEVRVGGRLTTNWSPEKLARAGVIRSWQAVGLFDAMTVEENLLVAAEAHSPVHYLSDLVRPGVPRRTQAVDGVVREFQLEPWLAHRRSELPQGIARLVAIGRAICANPSLLLLDEPTAGLDAVEASEIFRSVRRVAQRTGIGILVVEHDVPLMLGLCQRLVVLDFGRKIADGPSQMVSEDARVVSAYMGVGSELPAQGPTPRLAT
jgi:sulfate-transporting ATPase